MQTTLLGLAVAIILALVVALVGPLVVDWGRYRSAIEAEATRLIGLDVRISGAIDGRLLPSPRIVLQGVEIGRRGDDKLRADSLAVEFALGPLVRGQWRAAEMQLVGPQFQLELDRSGRLQVPDIVVGFRPDALAIERLSVRDGRIELADAASGKRIVLAKLSFNGEVRSLFGPFQGEGAFTLDHQLYPYRIAAGRVGEDGAWPFHLTIDPANLALTVDTEGAVSFTTGEPRFEGTLSLARPVGIAPPTADALLTQPWRFGGKIRVTPAAALMQQVEFQYGSEDQGVRLTGTAELKFGKLPRFDGVLSARQIDLDRVLGAPAAGRQPPAAVLRRLAELASGALRPPIPMRLGLGIDAVTLGGATIQSLRGDLSTDAGDWTLDRFEFRAPGFTQARLSGRLAVDGGGVNFSGAADVETLDLKVLAAWLEGRPEPSQNQMRALTARGELTLASDRLAIERLKIVVDRDTIEGRLAYVFKTSGQRSRLDAVLNASELDVDALIGFSHAALAGVGLERPQELALAFDIARATIGGIAARGASARLRLDAGGLALDRLVVADLGGAAFSAQGHIDMTSAVPRGNINVDLDARDLAAVTAVLAKFAPAAAEPLRRSAAALAPAKLRAALSFEPAAAPTGTMAKLGIDGNIGRVRVNLVADAQADVVAWDAAELHLQGRLAADDGSLLVAIMGLDRVVAVDKGPGVLSLNLGGRAREDMTIEARLTAGALQAVANGSLRLAGDQLVSAVLRAAVTGADVAPLRRLFADQSLAPLPLAATARIALSPSAVRIDDLAATVAGSSLHGQLNLAFKPAWRLDGELAADAIDASALIAAAVGMPATDARGQDIRGWSSEPFGPGALAGLDGQVTVKSTRATFTSGLAARQLKAVLHLAHGHFALDDIAGELAGGRVNGRLAFTHGDDGLTAKADLKLSGVDIAGMLPAGARPPLTGKLSLETALEGSGLSPVALIGSLHGTASIALADAQFAGLDLRVFGAVIRAVDNGLPIDGGKIAALASRALDGGALTVARAQAPLEVSVGQVRLAPVAAKGEGGDLSLAGNLDLSAATLDARLVLSSTAVDASNGGRPDIFIALKGPVAALERSIDVTALMRWLTQRAIDRQSKRLEAIESVRSSTAPGPAPSEQKPEIAPALPAPIEITPAPGPSRTGPRAQSEAPRANKPASLAPPARDPLSGRSIVPLK